MISNLKPWTTLSAEERRGLAERLIAYYRQNPEDYYAEADRNRGHYADPQMALHRRLLEGMSAGDQVVEVGCGTAHLAPEVCRRHANYTGLDWSSELIARNRRQLPGAEFYILEEAPPRIYDWVISLYTLEHVVDPPDYLEILNRWCAPGGRIGILCPDFVRAGGSPSLVFGGSALRIRQKIRRGEWRAATRHIWESEMLLRLWKYRANHLPPGQFWMNVKPRIFYDSAFGIDRDAIHLPHQQDIEDWFRIRGYQLEQIRDRIVPFPAQVPRNTVFLVVRKPLNS